ncbi:MAG: hypothetical protein HY782_15800 [Chloroflexi bacterium]|nr:hypothetical protein [Chloroflexota bacterium]
MLRIAIWFPIILTLIATACVPAAPAPIAATATPAVERASATTANTAASASTLVAFPTSTPIVPTAPAATVTLSAPSTPMPRGTGSAPVVQVISPLPNAQVSISQTVYVVVFAASDSAIARIELTADNVPVRSESAPTALQTFSAIIPWTPTQLGAYVLRVVAFDNNNVASAPEEISVSVTPDSRKPTAMIVYPIGTPQVELGSLVPIYAVATDEVGVTQLDLWVDNQIYTYVTVQNPGGQLSYSNVFAWTAMSPGTHTLLVRAHDNQYQTTDSAPLKVFVTDTHTPTVKVSFDRTQTLIGEPITLTIAALDLTGIQRVELWTSREVSSTITSANPARQTSLTVQLPWQASSAGDFPVTVRAYNANGNYKESPVQTISVLRPGQPTPTRAPTPTPTRTRAPRAQPTARLQPPPPPSAEISQPADRFAGPSPIRVTFGGRGNAELERIELWGYYAGQLNPQVICTIDAHATTQKTGQCDWSAPNAGAVSLYAQAIDIFHQVGRSMTISGVIVVPSLPTPTPTPISLAGRWTATTPTSQYVITFRPIVTQSGTALRGDFKIATVATPATEQTGRITSGTLKADRVTFRVEFTPATPSTVTPTPDTVTPTAAPTATPAVPALDFDCAADATGMMLDCKFKDARGQGGAAVFRREP